jgi:hypothetical protein
LDKIEVQGAHILTVLCDFRAGRGCCALSDNEFRPPAPAVTTKAFRGLRVVPGVVRTVPAGLCGGRANRRLTMENTGERTLPNGYFRPSG